jgi:uncharacterized protein YbjT (DUF2867 family)
MTSRTVLLAGATGLVGKELLRLLIEDATCGAVHSLVRKPGGSVRASKVTEHVVNFQQLPALPRCDDVLIALGTTIKVAGSQEAFRRVDHDYVLAVARAGLRSGAKRLGVVSALGADAKSRVFYNRVKGEMEAAVQTLGYEQVVLVQPSLLVGDREALGQPIRTGEVWARRLLGPISGLVPAAFRPVRAEDVARGLLAGLRSGVPGVTLIPSRDLHGT